jgi:hypothetical protein
VRKTKRDKTHVTKSMTQKKVSEKSMTQKVWHKKYDTKSVSQKAWHKKNDTKSMTHKAFQKIRFLRKNHGFLEICANLKTVEYSSFP